jgi:hypothetical protein
MKGLVLAVAETWGPVLSRVGVVEVKVEGASRRD